MSKRLKHSDIIEKLTLEEKVSLTSGKDFWQTVSIAGDETNVPSMFLSDGPHGLRRQAASPDHLGLSPSIPATCFPTAAALACTWNASLIEKMGEALGDEAVDERVNVVLGPGTNVKRNPLCGRNFEYFSEDPVLAGKMAAALVRGIQKNGISACVKHFALNNQETRRMVIDSIVDERTMREIYLKPFEIVVKEGKTRCLMSSYNKVNGTYSNENAHLMKDILRNEWGYEGVVVTDWGGGNDRVKGLLAGNELEMPSCPYANEDLLSAVKSGEIEESALDEAVDNLISLILSTEETLKNREYGELKVRNVDAHHDLAAAVAEEAVVLLKNDERVLPISAGTKIAVIGDFAKVPRYQGAGSSIVNPTKLDSVLSLLGFEIVKYDKNPLPCAEDVVTGAVRENGYGFSVVGYEPGFDRYGKKSDALLTRAVELAKKAEVVLCFAGLDEMTETEGLDRKDMRIPAVQLKLIDELCATGKKIVVVLSSGSAVEMPFASKAHAVLHSLLGGQAGARAVLNVLSGKVNPSGKLAESYPIKYEDVPSSGIYPGKKVCAEYREGPFVGYRYYSTAGVPVLYPFGYGLSYTTFEYSGLEIDGGGVRFDVTNTGDMDGSEVAQLYVGHPGSSVIRPVRELKAFAKVFVRAGEKVSVRLNFDEDTFVFFNVYSGGYETESGKYSVEIGASCEDIRLRGFYEPESGGASIRKDAEALPSYYSGRVKDVTREEFERLLNAGREEYRYNLPADSFDFYKKNRMVIGYNSTVSDLRYSKRWIGRLFAFGVRAASKFFKLTGNREMTSAMDMGVKDLPVRGLGKFAGLKRAQLDGLIMMFNGRFFKGLKLFRSIKKNKKRKKEDKSGSSGG